MSAITRRATAFAGALIALALLAGTFAVFVQSYPGQASDEQTMQSWAAHFGSDTPTSGWLGDHQLAVLAGIGLVLGVICAGRRSARLAAHAAILVIGAVVAAIALKTGLERPALGVGAANNSFPSNTVAAFGAAAFALIAVSPARIRRLVTVCSLVGATAVSVAVVGLQWHRPSDVIGGWLVAVAAAFAAECVLPVRGPSTSPTAAPSLDRGDAVRQVASPRQVPWRS
ncbi:phosphatase PAP2 family protein [Gordonia sp. HY002]|uniref:phosphatase PAP2 family protein n=1 Tax=Gordonia zhenghanii TaxID=2911516 RepID=UPI001EF13256|nr:phosphatase PAP2 family protein [Gordonia zhenghanii]MCF8569377.1 phosphatase PAP2 family protein [Gordonia zhenghanii]MCF8603618.1 phosphatase PAP2 family protein [Gordonia zhenghanii]